MVLHLLRSFEESAGRVGACKEALGAPQRAAGDRRRGGGRERDMKVVSAQAEAFVLSCLYETHPHLTPRLGSGNPGLSNMCAHLRQRFPDEGLMVAVTDEDGDCDQGCDVEVLWTDGPSVACVMDYCASFSSVRVGSDGSPLFLRENAWRRAFGTIGTPTARRSLSRARSLKLLEYLAGQFGKPFALMAPFAVGGESPIEENHHMDETVVFGARHMSAGELLRLALRTASWEGAPARHGFMAKRRAKR